MNARPEKSTLKAVCPVCSLTSSILQSQKYGGISVLYLPLESIGILCGFLKIVVSMSYFLINSDKYFFQTIMLIKILLKQIFLCLYFHYGNDQYTRYKGGEKTTAQGLFSFPSTSFFLFPYNFPVFENNL